MWKYNANGLTKHGPAADFQNSSGKRHNMLTTDTHPDLKVLGDHMWGRAARDLSLPSLGEVTNYRLQQGLIARGGHVSTVGR